MSGSCLSDRASTSLHRGPGIPSTTETAHQHGPRLERLGRVTMMLGGSDIATLGG